MSSSILVEVATVSNISLSNTQVLSAAVFGTGISENQIHLVETIFDNRTELGNGAPIKFHNRSN
jgi:phosphate/sulfate permease